jgi:hypothetical protein
VATHMFVEGPLVQTVHMLQNRVLLLNGGHLKSVIVLVSDAVKPTSRGQIRPLLTLTAFRISPSMASDGV